jgi:hypothetical protein
MIEISHKQAAVWFKIGSSFGENISKNLTLTPGTKRDIYGVKSRAQVLIIRNYQLIGWWKRN